MIGSRCLEEREGDMNTVRLPLVAHKGKRATINAAPSEGVPAVAQGAPGGPPLMTPLGLIAGGVLVYLEAHGATKVRRLIQMLEMPMALMTMGVGALVREGLAHGGQQDTDVLVELR